MSSLPDHPAMKALLLVTLSVHPISPFSALLAPPPPSSVLAMTFPAHCLPVHMPGCPAGRAQPHSGCAMTGAPCPGSQIRVEEWLLGDSDKLPLPAFQVGEQRPRDGTGLTQDHAVGTPMPPLLHILSLMHSMDSKHSSCLLS